MGVALSFGVVPESEYFFIVFGEVFELIPLAGLEVFESVVIFVFFPEDVINSVLNFVFEFKLIFLPHLHLHSFGFFFILVTEDFLFVKGFFHLFLVFDIFKVIFVLL